MYGMLYGRASVWIQKMDEQSFGVMDINRANHIADLPAGATFGEIALVSNQPRAASIKVDSDVAYCLEMETMHWEQCVTAPPLLVLRSKPRATALCPHYVDIVPDWQCKH